MITDFTFYNGLDYSKSSDNAIYPLDLSSIEIIRVIFLLLLI